MVGRKKRLIEANESTPKISDDHKIKSKTKKIDIQESTKEKSQKRRSTRIKKNETEEETIDKLDSVVKRQRKTQLENHPLDVKDKIKKKQKSELNKASEIVNDKSEESEVTKGRRSKTKRGKTSENEPVAKRAKVVLEKLTIKEEKPSEVSVYFNESKPKIISSVPLTTKFESNVEAEEPSTSKCLKDTNDDSSSDSEWEEVGTEQSLDDYKPQIPKEGVEITIECPELAIHKRKKKKEFDEREWIRLQINRGLKEVQLNVYKTHLLCLLAHGFYINSLLNSVELKGLALSLVTQDVLSLTVGKKADKVNLDVINKVIEWFRGSFSFETENTVPYVNVSKNIVKYFETRKALNASEYNLMFVAVARTLGLKTRLCMSLYPVTYKAQNLIKKSNGKKSKINIDEIESKDTKQKIKSEHNPKVKVPRKSEALKTKNPKSMKKSKTSNLDVVKDSKHARPKRSVEKSYKLSSGESDDDTKDEDFSVNGDEEEFEEQKPKRNSTKTPKQTSNRKVLSSDSEMGDVAFTDDKIMCWAEVFSKVEKQWISIDCVNSIVNKPYEIEAFVPAPITYILAYDNQDYVKDVTKRYCNEYMTSTIKLRPDSEWWEETLLPFSPPNSKLEKEEEKKLDDMLINKPLPTTVSGFKNHPLYALKRHLLKFEGIYPPDAAPVGFIRGEPVYPRECICQLHSRETWVKEARVVRAGEEPYKIVKARPKWDRIAGVMRTDLPLDVFGFWQTDPYQPPVAKDGKVPRNEYGNVELFKPCMLPKGTVHLQLPGLNRVAKKLGIDCSPAVVGFDGHKGSVHPVYDGFVICKEYKDTILAAWDEEQENARKREEEKREKRIYGNWKKLIRGLLIRERIKLKYDVK